MGNLNCWNPPNRPIEASKDTHIPFADQQWRKLGEVGGLGIFLPPDIIPHFNLACPGVSTVNSLPLRALRAEEGR